MKPNQYVKPSTYATAITDDHNGSIRYNTADVRSETEAANGRCERAAIVRGFATPFRNMAE